MTKRSNLRATVSSRILLLAILGCLGLSMPLNGCAWLFGGDGPPLVVQLRRSSDGATTACMTGSYPNGGLLHPDGEARARRFLNACVAACRKRGFVEDTTPFSIDPGEVESKVEQEWGNFPEACHG
jgi:hypothetical protein